MSKYSRQTGILPAGYFRKILRFTTVFFICTSAFSANGQSYNEKYPPYSLSNTEQRILHSETNGITYKLYVSYPPGYGSATAETYPVVYLLDADYSFALAKNATDHLSERNLLPEVILVAIAYAGENRYRLHRTRDYTPTHSTEGGYNPDVQKASGGGSDFLAFIEEELFPYVDRNFRTNGMRILAGHSFGGLFACWVMLTRPSAFEGYIAISPSLWYDDHYLFKLEEEKGEAVRSAGSALYMAVGSHEVNNRNNMPRDLQNFAAILRARKHPDLRLHSEILQNENHSSVFPGAFTRGIRFILNESDL